MVQTVASDTRSEPRQAPFYVRVRGGLADGEFLTVAQAKRLGQVQEMRAQRKAAKRARDAEAAAAGRPAEAGHE